METVHNFCQYCGSEREHQHWTIPCQECGRTPQSYHITVKQWLKYLLLQLIPFCNIYLLIRWGFVDKETHPTLRNYARFSLIGVVIGILFFIICMVALFSFIGVTEIRGY